MNDKIILLIEDNPDDADLTLRALKQNHILNQVVLARDGAEALDYLFGAGAYAGRDTCQMPQLVLLDLKLPKVDGLEVLRRLRAEERFASPEALREQIARDVDRAQRYFALCHVLR